MPLRLEQRKKSGIWRIRGSHYGVVIDQSARTRIRSEAQQILKGWEKDIFAQVHGLTETKQSYTFAHAAESWIKSGGNSTLYFYFGKVVTALADMKLEDITQGQLNQYATQLFPHHQPSTINRGFFALVSVILNHASDEKMMTPIRIKKLKTKRSRVNWQTPDQIETLLQCAGDFSNFITFMVGTGARTSEALRLEWQDVSLENERITFWTTKGGRARSVDLCNRVRAAMPARQKGRVWRRGDGLPWAETDDGRFYGPRQKLARICKDNDLPSIGIHSLRHSWASWQYALEKDPIKLMQKGGWSSLSMVENYTHLGTDDLKKSVLKHHWFDYDNGQYTGKISV